MGKIVRDDSSVIKIPRLNWNMRKSNFGKSNFTKKVLLFCKRTDCQMSIYRITVRTRVWIQKINCMFSSNKFFYKECLGH